MARRSTILGLAKLDRKLRRLPQVALNEIRTAMEAAAEQIVALARSLAPHGETGDLQDSIGWTWGAPPRGSLTLGKIARSALGKDLTITIYAGNDKAFYARWVEFGTAAHTIKARNFPALGPRGRYGYEVDHPGATAQPFFYPAFRANRKEVKRKIGAATRRAARKVAKGG